MRVMMLKDYGVYAFGRVYDLPVETAEQFIVMGIAVKARATDASIPNKAMRPNQIRKGGL